MTRIDELQKKYPTIPREVILKWEILNRGVRDTDDLDKASTWQRAGAHFSYQSYDHDVTLKDMVTLRPQRLKPGYILRPSPLYMKNGIGFGVRVDTRSPYEIRDVGDDRVAVSEGEDIIDVDVYMPRPKQLKTEDIMTSKGNPVANFISLKRRCFYLMPVRYCEYFATGDQCKFCNFNSTQEDSSSVGLDRPVTISLDETVESYKILGSQVRIIEGRLEMGGFRKSEQEARIYFDFVGQLASAAPYKPNLKVITQAMSRKDMQRLKDAGLDCLSIQMEVWEPELFPVILPGKAKHDPHEAWLQSYTDAVDVFGAGNVTGKIIGGLTMMPPNGHQTWQEARDSHIEGNRWMIKNGVFPVFTNLRLPPGSMYGEDKSNRQKLPPTEYYLDVALAHHEAMLEFGLYQKLNKLMLCPLCCIDGPYSGELGMLALAGDVSSWLADTVPYESSWLAQFLSSIKSPAEPRP